MPNKTFTHVRCSWLAIRTRGNTNSLYSFRAFDAAKAGSRLGVAAILSMSTALLKKSVRGGLIVVGEINLGGSIEPVHNAVTIAEIAVEKGATTLLMPVTCRRQLLDLSDDMATKVDIQFYSDARDALLKGIQD